MGLVRTFPDESREYSSRARGLESRACFTTYDRVLCKMLNSVYGLYATPFELTLNIE